VASVSPTRYELLSLLFSLSPSALDVVPRPHWIMGVPMYTKATSPIRRYFDMLLHQQLKTTWTAGTKPISEQTMVDILPSAYRHEQYLKQVEKVSVRYWTLKHLESVLRTNPDDPLLTTKLVLLDGGYGQRQKVWIESIGLVLHVNILGVLPSTLRPGVELDGARVLTVDPIRSQLDFKL
jgi:hypothetical protein